MKTTKQLTIKQALAEGYTKCLQDGNETVEDIGDVEDSLNDGDFFWICQKEPTPYTIGPQTIKDCLVDHVLNQSEMNDEDGELGEIVERIADDVFTPLTKIINEALSERKYWEVTNIQLIQ